MVDRVGFGDILYVVVQYESRPSVPMHDEHEQSHQQRTRRPAVAARGVDADGNRTPHPRSLRRAAQAALDLQPHTSEPASPTSPSSVPSTQTRLADQMGTRRAAMGAVIDRPRTARPRRTPSRPCRPSRLARRHHRRRPSDCAKRIVEIDEVLARRTPPRHRPRRAPSPQLGPDPAPTQPPIRHHHDLINPPYPASERDLIPGRKVSARHFLDFATTQENRRERETS